MSVNVCRRVIQDVQNGMRNLKREMGTYICPEQDNYFNVHFLIPGPEKTPFQGGLYHGMVRLDAEHPAKPPAVFMFTPSGRFNTRKYPVSAKDRGLCTTFTAWHPESWSPLNNLETIMKGFLSFMCDLTEHGIDSINEGEEKMRILAKASLHTLTQDKIVADLFPELHAELKAGTYQPPVLASLGIVVESASAAAPKSKPIPIPIRQSNQKTKPLESDDSSDSSDASETKEPPLNIKVIKATKSVPKIKKILNSDSESEPESATPEPVRNTKTKSRSKSKVKTAIKSSKKKSVVSDDDTSQEETVVTTTKQKQKQKQSRRKTYNTSDSDASDNDSPKVVKKSSVPKRRGATRSHKNH